MSLLPSRGPETSTAQEGELRVVGVDEDVAPIFDALSSETARDVLNQIYENPGTPSEIADRLDMSIQSVTYHIEKLTDVDLIDVAGTRYSEKGHEMTVYEPPDDPVVLFVGTEERKRTLRSLVTRLVPTIGILALASAAIQSVFGGGLSLGLGSPSGGEYAGDGAPTDDAGPNIAAERVDDAPTSTPEATAADGGQMAAETVGTSTPQPAGTPAPEPTGTPMAEPTGTPMATEAPDVVEPTAVEAASEGAATIDPGLAFFLGGLFVIAIVGVAWYYRSR